MSTFPLIIVDGAVIQLNIDRDQWRHYVNASGRPKILKVFAPSKSYYHVTLLKYTGERVIVKAPKGVKVDVQGQLSNDWDMKCKRPADFNYGPRMTSVSTLYE